jgi:hypothetical protein
MDSSNIVSYIHCGKCIRERGMGGKYVIGLLDSMTLRVWCQTCDKKIADFALDYPIEPKCDMCSDE